MPCIPPKFVLHGLSSKSKFLAIKGYLLSDLSSHILYIITVIYSLIENGCLDGLVMDCLTIGTVFR